MRIDYDKDQLAYALANALKERDDALSQIVQAECRAERFCQERDEAREKAERYRLEANAIMMQRDEAREALNNIRINLGEDADGFTLLHAVCALQNERDEARENLDEEMKFHHRTHRELVETQCKLLDMDLKREEALDEIKRLKIILDLIKKDAT